MLGSRGLLDNIFMSDGHRTIVNTAIRMAYHDRMRRTLDQSPQAKPSARLCLSHYASLSG